MDVDSGFIDDPIEEVRGSQGTVLGLGGAWILMKFNVALIHRNRSSSCRLIGWRKRTFFSGVIDLRVETFNLIPVGKVHQSSRRRKVRESTPISWKSD